MRVHPRMNRRACRRCRTSRGESSVPPTRYSCAFRASSRRSQAPRSRAGLEASHGSPATAERESTGNRHSVPSGSTRRARSRASARAAGTHSDHQRARLRRVVNRGARQQSPRNLQRRAARARVSSTPGSARAISRIGIEIHRNPLFSHDGSGSSAGDASIIASLLRDADRSYRAELVGPATTTRASRSPNSTSISNRLIRLNR